MARQAYTDAQILEALRAAAAHGQGPLSHTRYDAVSREVGGPSSARVIQRFGSWRTACEAAGVAPGTAARAYSARWHRQSVADAVARYLSEEAATGTYADYQAWAAGREDRPSGPTVRNVMGGWNEAKAATRS
jgi:hypothetical protein